MGTVQKKICTESALAWQLREVFFCSSVFYWKTFVLQSACIRGEAV